MVPRADINELARRQHGVLAIRQLTQLGMADSTVRDIAAREGWERAGRGLFYLPGSSASFQRDVATALLRMGEPSVASHDTAAALWGLAPPHERPIHVMVPHDRAAAQTAAVRTHRTRRWDDEDLSTRDGVPCLTVERTLVEMAAVGSHVARGLVVEAVRRGLTTPARLARRAAALRGVPGSRRAHGFAAMLAEGRFDSEAERIARDVVDRLGLRAHREPYAVRLPNGRRALVDIALVDLRVAIEVDGFRFHRSHDDLRRDHERQNQLHAAGWIVVRVGWQRLHEDPEGFAAELMTIVERRRGELGIG